MNLLEIIEELSLEPKRTSSSHGGEYHCPCPSCGGEDRFMFWPSRNRYWCRQCDRKGDSIQFCRDFMGMDYRSACLKVGVEPKTSNFSQVTHKPLFIPRAAEMPSKQWLLKAKNFVDQSHQNLISSPKALQLLYDRGFSLESIKNFSLGWNNADKYFPRSDWGLEQSDEGSEQSQKLRLPKGIVIPTKKCDQVIKLKIRRGADEVPKYFEVSGSMKSPSFYGFLGNNVALLVESELDAMLVQQVASDLCFCVAIGGARKKPDLESHRLLQEAEIVLFSLDFDDAGKQAYSFWKTIYLNLKPWPVPEEKSPGDAHLAGVDLREWVIGGLELYNS